MKLQDYIALHAGGPGSGRRPYKFEDEETGKIKTGKLPRYMYHGTSSQHLTSIQKHGLLPSKEDGVVSLTDDPKYAEQYATEAADKGKGGDPLVLKVDTAHGSFDSHEFEADPVWRAMKVSTARAVDPGAISVHDRWKNTSSK